MLQRTNAAWQWRLARGPLPSLPSLRATSMVPVNTCHCTFYLRALHYNRSSSSSSSGRALPRACVPLLPLPCCRSLSVAFISCMRSYNTNSVAQLEKLERSRPYLSLRPTTWLMVLAATLCGFAVGALPFRQAQASEWSVKAYAPTRFLLNSLRDSIMVTPKDKEAGLHSRLYRQQLGRVLLYLSQDGATAVKMTKEGAIPILKNILTLLEQHQAREGSMSHELPLQSILVGVLTNLACCAENRTAVLDDQECLQRFVEWSRRPDPDQGQRIAQALARLAQAVPARTNNAAAAEASVRLLMHAINNLVSNSSATAQTKLLAARAIGRLGKIEPYRRCVVEEGGLESLQVLVVANNNDNAIQLRVAKSILLLAQTGSIMKTIIESGWLGVFTVWAKSDDRQLRMFTTSILEELLHNDETALGVIRELGFGPLLHLTQDVALNSTELLQRVFAGKTSHHHTSNNNGVAAASEHKQKENELQTSKHVATSTVNDNTAAFEEDYCAVLDDSFRVLE
ncbi:hypothetical protein QOT17_011432 [Balamuthia mandrillaris]